MTAQGGHADRVIRDLGIWLGAPLPAVDELAQDEALLTVIEGAVADEPFFRTKKWSSPLEFGVFRTCLYVLVRALKPDLVIETGVLHGLTSLFLLRALARNGGGRLVSIDLPSYFGTPPANQDGCDDTLPPGRGPGWIVDPHHARRWQLKLGNSLELLPGILADESSLGLFLHDSDHSDAVMGGELRLAWDRLSPGGVIVCDNIDMCPAFYEFCRAAGLQPFLVPERPSQPPRFGIVMRVQENTI